MINHELVYIDKDKNSYISGTITKKKIAEQNLVPMENEIEAVSVKVAVKAYSRRSDEKDAIEFYVKMTSGEIGTAIVSLDFLFFVFNNVIGAYEEDGRSWLNVKGLHLMIGQLSKVEIVQTIHYEKQLILDQKEKESKEKSSKLELEVGKHYKVGWFTGLYIGPVFSTRLSGRDHVGATKRHLFYCQDSELRLEAHTKVKEVVESVDSTDDREKAEEILRVLKGPMNPALSYFYSDEYLNSGGYISNTNARIIALTLGMPATKKYYNADEADFRFRQIPAGTGPKNSDVRDYIIEVKKEV